MEESCYLEDTEQTRRLKNICLNKAYSCGGDIYNLLEIKVLHDLVLKIQTKKKVQLVGKLAFGKNVISAEEQFLYILSKYIGYVKDTYHINHIEVLCVIEETLLNKYNKVLFNLKDYHKEKNYELYMWEFKKMFLSNLVENITFFAKNVNKDSKIYRFYNIINDRIISNKQDLLFLEEKFLKVFNETHHNVYNCFISYTELTENQYPFYIMQFELLLSNYFYEDDNNHDCLTITKKDIDSCYYNDTKTLDIYNLKKDHIEKILKGLILLQKSNINDKRIDRLIKKFKLYSNMFEK